VVHGQIKAGFSSRLRVGTEKIRIGDDSAADHWRLCAHLRICTTIEGSNRSHSHIHLGLQSITFSRFAPASGARRLLRRPWRWWRRGWRRGGRRQRRWRRGSVAGWRRGGWRQWRWRRGSVAYVSTHLARAQRRRVARTMLHFWVCSVACRTARSLINARCSDQIHRADDIGRVWPACVLHDVYPLPNLPCFIKHEMMLRLPRDGHALRHLACIFG